jgi:hypothetical protein
LLIPWWDWLAAAAMIAIGAAARLVAAVVVAWAAIGHRLGHRVTGAMVWPAGPGARLVG